MAQVVNGKRVNVTDEAFVTAWVSAQANGGTLKGLANSLQLSYGNVIARGKRLSDMLVAGGKKPLPKFGRAEGVRAKDLNTLADIIG